MSAYPKDLVISLQHPARILLTDAPLEMTGKRVTIAGERVDGNDTPWPAMADLLVDRVARELIGFTFCVPFDEEAVRRLSSRLDPRVVRFNDMSTSELRRPYNGSNEHWFEIVWKRTHNVQMEFAQLMNGQYWWWYALHGDWKVSKPIVAISFRHVGDILADHGLSFPSDLDLPPLEVRCE